MWTEKCIDIVPSGPLSARSSTLKHVVVSCRCLCLALVSWAAHARAAGDVPYGGVPLARGMVWTGSGIGATASGGATITDGASPLNGMDGIGWYHYKEWLIAGAGFHLTMTRDADDASVFFSRYEIHSSMIWPVGRGGALQLDLPACFGKRDFYQDTLAGADPVFQTESYVGSGLLAAAGWCRKGVAASVTTGFRWSWWTGLERAENLDLAWEVEPRLSLGLQNMWPRSDSLTKAWDLVVSLPAEHLFERAEVSRVPGRSYDATSWKIGFRIGLAVVL